MTNMDFETREIVEKILQLTEENNKILRKMRRSIVWGRIFHAVYWLVIIGISVGAYYYVQPYIEDSIQLFNATQNGLESLNEATKVIDSLKGVMSPSR